MKIMVMPNLLLEKPAQKLKSKDHLSALDKRMELWESGELLVLLKEAETIQKYLKATNKHQLSKKYRRNSVAKSEEVTSVTQSIC